MKPFSVIVPTSGRGDALRRVLDSIQTQSGELIQEIIVVSDSASAEDGIAAMYPGVRSLATGGRKGPSVARNLGASRAVADYLVFVDDDVVPGVEALDRLWACVQRAQGACAWVGQIVPDRSVPDSCYLRLAYSNVAHNAPDAGMDSSSFWHFCTSLACVRRGDFSSAGGFDERFTRPGYEDVELGYRLRRNGVKLALCPGAVGNHLRVMDRAWFMGRCEIVGGLLRKMHELHPETRRPVHVLLRKVAWAAPGFKTCWRMFSKSLGCIEAMPMALSIPMLRLVHAVGLAAGYTQQIA